MNQITDFTHIELGIIKETLLQRYQQDIPLEFADADIRLSPADRELTPCPAVYWQVENVNFIIFKVANKGAYRCQFFYRGHEQFGTGIEEYDNIGDCVIALLKAQTQHEQVSPGAIEKY